MPEVQGGDEGGEEGKEGDMKDSCEACWQGMAEDEPTVCCACHRKATAEVARLAAALDRERRVSDALLLIVPHCDDCEIAGTHCNGDTSSEQCARVRRAWAEAEAGKEKAT